MSLFTKILEKLGLKKHEDNPATSVTGASGTAGRVGSAGGKTGLDRTAASGHAASGQAGPSAVSEVDVVKKLESMGAGTELDWKVSIVDLLRLLDIDSSREARNDLAKELGCPPELMSDSAKMNVWLHKAVLRKIAQNGGNIPADLLD